MLLMDVRPMALPSMRRSVYPSVRPFGVRPSVPTSVHPSVCSFVRLSVRPSVSHFISSSVYVVILFKWQNYNIVEAFMIHVSLKSSKFRFRICWEYMSFCFEVYSSRFQFIIWKYFQYRLGVKRFYNRTTVRIQNGKYWYSTCCSSYTDSSYS